MTGGCRRGNPDVTTIEKLGLLGYVVGAVEHCSRTNLKVKVCFGDYLRIVLLETGILILSEIEQMLANWDDLINSGPFRSASESAGEFWGHST